MEYVERMVPLLKIMWWRCQEPRADVQVSARDYKINCSGMIYGPIILIESIFLPIWKRGSPFDEWDAIYLHN